MPETKRPTNEKAEEILGLYFPVLDHGFNVSETTIYDIKHNRCWTHVK